MVITKETVLPEMSSLSCEEVNLSQSTLMAAAPYVGKKCEAVNNEFMLCRQELKDPRACVELGKQVTACALDVFRQIKKKCLEEFKQYHNCIDKSSGNFDYAYCRNTQVHFDRCVLDRMCIERPHFGYFTRGRVHSSPWPAPAPPCACGERFTDRTPQLPTEECFPRVPARFGSRYFWMTE